VTSALRQLLIERGNEVVGSILEESSSFLKRQQGWGINYMQLPNNHMVEVHY